ncbi:MAG: PQQ-dependent sugar dehydrogenase [Planctomycetes bacterium]|nr:PQQ-dependent sugar dehydrogenase [Planctomycetota bacterium]
MIPLLFMLTFTQIQNDFWSVDYLSPPSGAVLEVGGIGFMSDGDLVASTRRGQVWRVDSPNATNPNDATFTLICEGLHEGLGLAVIEDEIFIMQRGEISKLVDLDGDTIIDEVQTITQDWGLSGNYHEFGFGLPVDQDGNMYFSLNVGFWNPHWWHGKSRAPYRGWVLKLAPDGTVTPIAGGLRSPAGLGLLDDGTLLVTDNQGDWMAVCPVYAIKDGAFYGHPASLRWYEDQPDTEPSDTIPTKVSREHPVLWLPYQWSRSTGNVIKDNTDGPFHGQYLIAELTNGQILRAQFEEINGVLQGACWIAHKRIGSAYHIEYGPDGTLYAGLTNRGWGGLAPGNGIARVKYNGELPLEMQSANLLKDGFVLTFNKCLASSPTVTGTKYDYNYWWEYGSPQQHVEELEVSQVTLSEDRLSVTVTIDNLEAGKCVMLTLEDTTDTDGLSLLHNEVSYTINTLPGGELIYIAKQVQPPVERGEEVEGWLYLTWDDATDMWTNNGVELCDAELDIQVPTQFKTSEGMGSLVASVGESMATKFDIVDGELLISYMFAQKSEAEIKLPIGMSVVLSDEQDGGYLGAGIWHKARIQFQANPPKITSVEINNVTTDVDIITSSGLVKPSPLEIKCIKGNFAFGDVRLKTDLKVLDSTTWEPLQADGVEIALEGVASQTKTLPHSNFTSIRFDTTFSTTKNGYAVVTIGDLEVFIATQGDQKTGSITGHPIKANLVDQDEWCTIEINQDDEQGRTVVYLNDVPILTVADAPSIQSDAIRIDVHNAKLRLRKSYIK